MSAAKSSGSKQDKERPSYWLRTSPSSPSHVLHTLHHAFFALSGAGSFACFSYAMLQQRPFDASLAAVLVLVCLYIYTLQSERCRQKAEWRESVVGASLSGLSIDPLPVDTKKGSRAKSKAAAKSAADGTSELDLTGYAKTLGVSIRNGVVHKEGSTLNKILMDALAKEYLRCVSALRCYQDAFGPLQEDAQDPDEVRTQSAAGGTREPSMRGDPLNTTYNSLNLGMDLASLANLDHEGEPGPTPRSPAGLGGPPSPEPKRCRQPPVPLSSESQPMAIEATPAPMAPLAPSSTPAENPQTSSLSNIHGSESTGSTSAGLNQSCEDTNPDAPVWSLDDVKTASHMFSETPEPRSSSTQSAPAGSFGLFGGSRRHLGHL